MNQQPGDDDQNPDIHFWEAQRVKKEKKRVAGSYRYDDQFMRTEPGP
jgi:hypothetical protein